MEQTKLRKAMEKDKQMRKFDERLFKEETLTL